MRKKSFCRGGRRKTHGKRISMKISNNGTNNKYNKYGKEQIKEERREDNGGNGKARGDESKLKDGEK